VKRIAILARNDLFPLAIGEEMQKSAKKRNLDVVMFEKYAIGTLDHASAITQMRAARPDWVFATGYINDLILIRKQMRDLGVAAPVVTMIAGPAYKEFIDAVGPLAENISSAAWWHPAVRYNGKGVFGSTESFNKLWSTKYNGEPDYAQASAAAAGEIFQLAVETAGALDPAKVRDALAAMDTETFFGRIKFGVTGQISSLDPPVFQLQGGKPVVIFPDYVKQAEFKFGVQ
jgi:branched-chain amino acid transport system substrate-binding protein